MLFLRAIDDEIFLSHKRAMSDAEFYELTKRAEANKLYLLFLILMWKFDTASSLSFLSSLYSSLILCSSF